MLRGGVPEDHAVLPDLGGVLPRRGEALPDGAHEGEAKRANGLAPPHAASRALDSLDPLDSLLSRV